MVAILSNSSILLANRIKQFSKLAKNIDDIRINQLLKQYRLATNKIPSIKLQDLLFYILSEPITILNGSTGTYTRKIIADIIDIYKLQYPIATVTVVDSLSINDLLNKTVDFESDLIVVNQFHLVDAATANKLFSAISLRTKVLLVGDSDQISHDINLLNSLMIAGIPSVTLEVLDTDASPLIINAHRIKHGHCITCTNNFQFIDVADDKIPDTVKDISLQMLDMGYKKDAIHIYTPVDTGDLGVSELKQITKTKVSVLSTHSAPIVIVILAEKHMDIMTRNYLYTVLTRADDKVILIGSYKALNAARFNNKAMTIDMQLIERLNKNICMFRGGRLLTV